MGTRADRSVKRFTALALVAAVALIARACPVGADEAERIVEVLDLGPGMTAADVGAGDGDWALVLSAAVGETGTVYATEVDEDLVERLETLGLDNFRLNIQAVLGDERSSGLEPGCCDGILLRMVYHHFTDPPAMRANLLAALMPGGRLAVIDIVPQADWGALDGVPDRGGHGIEIADLVAEMIGAGFEIDATHREWREGDEDRYCVVFRAPKR